MKDEDRSTETVLIPPSQPNGSATFPLKTRLRRRRYNSTLRHMLSESRLTINDFILPLFIREGHEIKEAIHSLPGHHRWSIDRLDEELTSITKLKIPAVILFGLPAKKDPQGSVALDSQGVIQQTIRKIKLLAPQLLVIADLCFCSYTDHGHCGVLSAISQNEREVDNDLTLALLQQQAISLAQAGADIIAPSGMMDGMVGALRVALDQAGFIHIPILSYAIKYASAFYGPFREAAQGAPKFGDRRSYQLNIANANEALYEAKLDIEEGADLLMVKPAQNYLDVIYRVKTQFPYLPLVAYQVSGEYAMIKAAAQNGWIDESQAMIESLIAIKRAGADLIISYFAKELASHL